MMPDQPAQIDIILPRVFARQLDHSGQNARNLHHGHVLAAFVDVEGGSRQIEGPVEGGIGVLTLIPRHTRAIS